MGVVRALPYFVVAAAVVGVAVYLADRFLPDSVTDASWYVLPVVGLGLAVGEVARRVGTRRETGRERPPS